jgi:muconolactone D-isomerase
MEYLVTMTTRVPEGALAAVAGDARAREAVRARELAGQGHLPRLRGLPGKGRALGLRQARDAAGIQAMADSLPLTPWMSTQITPLSEHPRRPGSSH